MPPSPGRSRRPLFPGDRLNVIDWSAVFVIVAVIALVGGAGGVMIAAPDPAPAAEATTLPGVGSGSTAPPSTPASGQPQPTATASLGADPAATATPTATPQPTPTPRPTPTPQPRSDPPELLSGYVWPLRGARLSGRFGPRADGLMVVDGQRVHDGIDLATWCGDKVRAAHDGVVLYAGRKFDPYLGYSEPPDALYARITNPMAFPIVVVIDDGNGYRSVYVHLGEAKVGAGDVVKAGQTIGLEGATGRATGCHLHYSLIRMDGPWRDVAPSLRRLYPPRLRERVDPLAVLPLDDPFAPPRLRERHAPSPRGDEPPAPVPPFDR